MKKIIIIGLTLIMAMILIGCNNKNNNGLNFVSGNIIQSGDENREQIIQTEEKLFYFVGSELFAIYEDGIIKPIKNEMGEQIENITYDEVFSTEYFTEYSLESQTNDKIDKIKLAIFDDEFDSNAENDIVKVLLNYGEKAGTAETYLSEQKYDVYEISLPVELPNDISNVDAFRAIGENGFGYWLELAKANSLVTNASFNIEFEPKAEDTELSSNIINEIEEYVENNNISKELQYFCTSKFVVDLDNDTLPENMYVIETYHLDRNDNSFVYYNNNDVVETGAFSLILLEKSNGEIDTIFESKILPLNNNLNDGENTGGFFENNVLGYIEQPDLYIVDLNNDNDKELLVDARGIELEGGKLMQLYNTVDGNYKKIATSYYGYGL